MSFDSVSRGNVGRDVVGSGQNQDGNSRCSRRREGIETRAPIELGQAVGIQLGTEM